MDVLFERIVVVNEIVYRFNFILIHHAAVLEGYSFFSVVKQLSHKERGTQRDKTSKNSLEVSPTLGAECVPNSIISVVLNPSSVTGRWKILNGNHKLAEQWSCGPKTESI